MKEMKEDPVSIGHARQSRFADLVSLTTQMRGSFGSLSGWAIASLRHGSSSEMAEKDCFGEILFAGHFLIRSCSNFID